MFSRTSVIIALNFHQRTYNHFRVWQKSSFILSVEVHFSSSSAASEHGVLRRSKDNASLAEVRIICESIISAVVVFLSMQLRAVYLHLNCHLVVNVENDQQKEEMFSIFSLLPGCSQNNGSKVLNTICSFCFTFAFFQSVDNGQLIELPLLLFFFFFQEKDFSYLH